jgi:hypothetical protein
VLLIKARRSGWPFEQGIPALVGFGCGHIDGRRATIAPTLSTAIVAAAETHLFIFWRLAAPKPAGRRRAAARELRLGKPACDHHRER